jgi:hypothetical protein
LLSRALGLLFKDVAVLADPANAAVADGETCDQRLGL